MLTKPFGIIKFSLLVSCLWMLASCHAIIETSHSNQDLNGALVANKPNLKAPGTKSFLRKVSKNEALNAKKITYSSPSASLLEVLTSSVPEFNVVSNDPGAELTLPLNISVSSMPLPKFLAYLEGLTGYDLSIKQNTIVVSARMTKQWNLSALASMRKHTTKVGQTVSGITKGAEGKEDTASTTTQFENKLEEDQWDLLIKSARTIIGAPEKENPTAPLPDISGSGATAFAVLDNYAASAPPFVVANRSMGIIMASGEPRRIKMLDNYIQNLERASSVQVNIDMKAFDVTLNDDKGAGIDWAALKTGVWGFAASSPTSLLGLAGSKASASDGLWSGTLTYSKGNHNYEAAIKFLENYGKVQLLSDPNLTVVNGTTAYLSSGDEFSFVSDVEQTESTAQNGNPTVSVKSSRLRIGVTMSVTPRLLEGDRILLDIVPVVSSFKKFTSLGKIGAIDGVSDSGVTLQSPDIALQELSTQVIARSGETIQLGGLITRKIEEALTRVPLKSRGLTGLFDFIFKNSTNKLQRRELVLLVTPTLVESQKWSP